MAHWYPGRVIIPKDFLDSHLKRFFIDYEVAWVIARHQGFIYFKIKWKVKEEIIARCAIKNMSKYFNEKLFHEDMPYITGQFRDIKIFPDDFFNLINPEPGKV